MFPVTPLQCAILDLDSKENEAAVRRLSYFADQILPSAPQRSAFWLSMRKSRTSHHLVGRPNGAAKLAPAMERAGINASTIRPAEAPGGPTSAAAARHHQ